MSTRLTKQLITYGLSNNAVNALSDGGYWNLDTLLETVATWKPMQRSTAGAAGVELYEYLNVAGIGPTLNAELIRALANLDQGMPQPWAPNPQAAGIVDEIVRDINDGRIKHGEPLTPASQLVLARRT